MRVVVVSPSLPLPFGTADARWLHIVVGELARRGHDVTCVSSTEELDEQVDAADQHVEALGATFRHARLQVGGSTLRRRLGSLRRPFSEHARSASLREVLDDVLAVPTDILHIEHLFLGWLALAHDRSIVYVHHLEVVDWEERQGLSARDRQVLLQMRRATRTLLRRVPRLVVATDRLAREVQQRGASPVAVVPIAVDASLYEPVGPAADPVVGLIGSMHWWPSRTAAERLLDLWPRIRERCPDARLRIAGWNAERHLANRFPLVGAELVGHVDEPSDFFRSVAVLVYPTPRGSGMKVKVLESLAYGVPVVTNAEGAEGLVANESTGVLLAESDDEVVERTVELLADPERRRRVGSAGRAHIVGQTPAAAVDRLLAAYEAAGLA